MRGLGLLLALVGCSPPAPTTVTLEEFRQVQSGMTYMQVVWIVGADGTTEAKSDGPGFRIQSYRWSNPDGSNLSISFTNGRATVIAQSGLR